MMILSIWNLLFLLLLISSLTMFVLGLYTLNMSTSVCINWGLYSWGSSTIDFMLLMDWVSFMFISFVLLISGSVFFYSGEYMEGELNMSRFILLLLAFVSSMGLLIFSPNLISLLLGWDGLGLVSYCLVIFYQNYKSLNAGMLTVLSNRVGDVFILVAIVYMLNYGDWSLAAWLGSSPYLKLGSLLIVLASLTKSAQIPFSAWLPAAMAAPTPVSSLVHSSTLVTAGVYLVIRLGWIYDFWLNDLLMILSTLTMFMAGLGACFEFDLKKVIALSTLSQLGLMMFSLSLGLVKMALFHLIMHALFKALLFMSAGCIIHSSKGWQDLRLMGNCSLSLPYISSCFVISNMALAGMPFLAGFYSKDLILEISLYQEVNMMSVLFLFLSTGLTVMYTLRLIYYVVVRDHIMSGSMNLSDGWGVMIKSTLGLSFFSIIFGASMSWVMIESPEIFLPSSLKNLTLVVCLTGAILGFIISQSSLNSKSLSISFYTFSTWFSASMWFMPYLSSQFLMKIPLLNGGKLVKEGDLGWLEHYGGQGLSESLSSGSENLQSLVSYGVKLYIFVFWALVVMFVVS
uniref:NADH-ubiquinone oxidoreductase chain 5 n=1 Tax=Lepas australis TaxID=479279 RepID=A0A089PR66_9CRUS|nr:NADH dehydrogenase subunit 5 [Lepas australis]AIQ85054.1 NADH dehydrogenase subunit 5 [Lepas australis]